MAGARTMPRADEVLGRFFTAARAACEGRRVERLRSAERDLRACIDEFAPTMFSPQERLLLELERQFEAASAVARTAEAGVVLLLLPLYLDEPRWHGEDLEDRRLRIRIAEPLADQVVHACAGVDLGRAAWVVGAAVRHEIWLLRQERQAIRRG